MFGFIFAFILLTSSNFIFSFYNKRFEETLIISMGGIILFLYLFYIFNFLNIGYYILLIFLSGLLLYSVYKFTKAKNKKEILLNYFTPGFIIYTVCFIIIFLIVRHREVLLWDELRLWGAYPKALYYDGVLQLGNGVKLLSYMQSYQPGMPLFQFFFTKSAFAFKESYLFLSYALLCLSALLPITKKLTYKKWYLIPVFILILLFVPLFLANSRFDDLTYYYTLFIEPALGIFFAYTLYLSTQKMDNKIDKAAFYLSLSTLVLLKDTGIIFALTSCLSYFFIHRKEVKKNKKERFKLLIPILLCISLFFSWKVIQKINNTDNMYGQKMDMSEITTFFTNMTDEQKEILSSFLQKSKSPIFDSNFDRLEPYINFYTVSIFILSGMIIIICLKKKNEKRVFKIATIWYFIGSSIFVLGTLALYLFSLHGVECFQRYTSVVLTAGILFNIMVVTNGILNNEKIFNILGLYIALFFVMATPMKSPYNMDYLVEYAEKSKYLTDVVLENVKSDEKLALVYGSSTAEELEGVIYDHHIYMNLIDEGYMFPISCTLSLHEINYQDYDYIYLFIIHDEDIEEMSKIANEPVEKTTLYKIENNNFIKVS